MHMKLVVAGLMAAAGAGGALAWQAQPARPIASAPAPAPRAWPAVQALADRYVAENKAVGIVIAVAQGDVAPTFASAGRIAEEPTAAKADPDSLWRVYSMTKPITGMAAMLLVEDGKLKLDQPVADFIPGFGRMTVATDPEKSLAGVPATSPVTVRELLTHTSGLSYSIMAKGALLKETERLGVLPGAINAQIEAQMRPKRPTTLAGFADNAAKLPLVAQPGTKWSYSIGLDVAARVIEVASGMPFERFVQTRLLDPLRMTSTVWRVKPGDVNRFATNYVWMGDNRVPFDPAATSVYLQPPSFPYGGAGLVASARDYDRFLHMLANLGTLDGARVMKPETARLAMSNLMPPGVTFQGLGQGTGGTQGANQGFGAGGTVYLADGPDSPGKGTYGWGGAAGTIAFVNPVTKMRVTAMVNYFPAEKWPLRQDIARAIAADLARR